MRMGNFTPISSGAACEGLGGGARRLRCVAVGLFFTRVRPAFGCLFPGRSFRQNLSGYKIPRVDGHFLTT